MIGIAIGRELPPTKYARFEDVGNTDLPKTADDMVCFDMTKDPQKGHSALRRGRASVVGATYFLTLGIADRKTSLLEGGCLGGIFAELGRLEGDGAIARLRCAVVMQDHTHLLFQLGDRINLGQIVSRLKAKTKYALERNELRWQGGYHDHRIDVDEELFPVFAYLFRNPVRAGLVDDPKQHPGWMICRGDAEWFYPEVELTNRDEAERPSWMT